MAWHKSFKSDVITPFYSAFLYIGTAVSVIALNICALLYGNVFLFMYISVTIHNGEHKRYMHSYHRLINSKGNNDCIPQS